LIRPKEISDNAVPSGNALACEALLKLASFTDEGHYRDLAEKALLLVGDSALRYPLGFTRWLSALELALRNTKQVAVVSDAGHANLREILKLIRSEYRPGLVVASSIFPPPNTAPPLLRDRPLLNGKTAVYVCEGFVCRQPSTDLEIIRDLLKE
jgi:uncharacterized protein YyaL (SSP411 family)